MIAPGTDGAHRPGARRFLLASFDVTGLTDAEVDRLTLEVVVQAEASDADDDHPGHPDVTVETTVLEVGTSAFGREPLAQIDEPPTERGHRVT